MVEQNGPRSKELGFAGAKRLSNAQKAEVATAIQQAFERVKPTAVDERAARHAFLKQEVGDLLSTLNERERRVTELRNGLLDGRNWTQAETARELGVSRRTVGRAERSVSAKLRPPVKPTQGGLSSHFSNVLK